MMKIESSSQVNQESSAGVSRREILLGIGAAATVAYAGTASSAMQGHDHSKHTAQQPDLLDAANDCLDKGQRCIAHCLVSFQEGDLEICDAFSYLLAANSEYVKAYAGICEKACNDCEKECRKHEEHVECKACAEACANIADQIRLRLS